MAEKHSLKNMSDSGDDSVEDAEATVELSRWDAALFVLRRSLISASLGASCMVYIGSQRAMPLEVFAVFFIFFFIAAILVGFIHVAWVRGVVMIDDLNNV